MNVLNNLQKRNNSLKLKLLHNQLKYGTYQFNDSKRESLLVLNAYRKYKSITKAALSVGVDKGVAMDWFIQGGLGDPNFKGFYLAINEITGFNSRHNNYDFTAPLEKNYEISEFENAWSYTTEIDGDKVSIISGNLDKLRDLVKSRNLPID